MTENPPSCNNGVTIPEEHNVPNNVLVTGSSGLVGSHLIAHLLQRDIKVRALYRKDIPQIAGSETIEWVKGDILDVVSLENALENIDHVYHCAAMVSFNRKHKQHMFSVNIDGTANIVNEALNAGVKKLCYVSSVAAIGKQNKGIVINETMSWNESATNSNYAISKYHAEGEVWRGIGEGLQAVIVNPSIILGASDWNKGSSKIFKTAYSEFPWYTDGATGFVDVNDVVDAMLQLMESNVTGQRFILSADNCSFKDVFTAAAIAFGKKPPNKKVSPLLAEIVTLFEGMKSLFTGDEPLLTKETAQSAQSVVRFSNNKLKKFLPNFNYTSLNQTISRVCKELLDRYQL